MAKRDLVTALAVQKTHRRKKEPSLADTIKAAADASAVKKDSGTFTNKASMYQKGSEFQNAAEKRFRENVGKEGEDESETYAKGGKIKRRKY